MADKNDLSTKSCRACSNDTAPFDKIELHTLLKQLEPDWSLNENDHLYRVFKFSNFKKAFDFATKVAQIAELEGHHPDIYVAWGKCAIEIWTHAINGLSENDFILAAKIEEVFM